MKERVMKMKPRQFFIIQHQIFGEYKLWRVSHPLSSTRITPPRADVVSPALSGKFAQLPSKEILRM
jgi:hypothetical protein